MVDDRAQLGSRRDASGAELGDGVAVWLLFFALATVGTVIIMLANAGADLLGSLVAIALVIVTQVVYAVVARPSLAGIRSDTTRAWTFAVVAVVLFAPAVYLNQWASASLFALTPELFLLLTFPFAAGAIVVLNASSTGVQIALGAHTAPQVVQQVGISVFIVTFSLFFGSRMVAIAQRSAERLRLITALREREAEVSALSTARGAEQERTRISREMHDTLAQGFASIVTLGHAAQGAIDTDPVAAHRQVELITRTAQENLAESRRIIAALAPARLEGATLVEAVGRVVASFGEETGIDATFEVTGRAVPIVPAGEVVALRVVQECLTNIRKHADAATVRVGLDYGASALVIEVRDDGAGFDLEAPSAGFGLAGMRARVAESGGALAVRSTRGAGTRIAASIPLGASS
jgi:signal transduction histidine kinase